MPTDHQQGAVREKGPSVLLLLLADRRREESPLDTGLVREWPALLSSWERSELEKMPQQKKDELLGCRVQKSNENGT